MKPDQVLIDIVNRTMKQIAINRAKECGASDSLLEQLENSHGQSVYMAVDALFGIDISTKKEK